MIHGRQYKINFINMNPIDEVRRTCMYVCENSLNVTIDLQALNEIAKNFSKIDMSLLREGVQWDSSGWHYTSDSKTYGPLTCQYIFLLDSLNFCFWPTSGLEYDYLATSLKKVSILKKTKKINLIIRLGFGGKSKRI